MTLGWGFICLFVLRFIIFTYVSEGMPSVPMFPWRPQEGVSSPRAGAPWTWEPAGVAALEAQQELLTS